MLLVNRLLKINKFTIPKLKRQENWFDKVLAKFKLPKTAGSNPFFQFAKRYRYYWQQHLFLLICLFFIPIKNSYEEVKGEVDGLLVELNRHKPSKILDRNVVLVSEIFQKKTGTLKLSDYPPKLIKIILSVEDQNFYKA